MDEIIDCRANLKAVFEGEGVRKLTGEGSVLVDCSNEEEIMWSAIYLPESDQGLSRSGFKSRYAAVRYVCRHNCESCKPDGFGSACAAEWLVLETAKLEGCEDLGDLLDAAGFERVE